MRNIIHVIPFILLLSLCMATLSSCFIREQSGYLEMGWNESDDGWLYTNPPEGHWVLFDADGREFESNFSDNNTTTYEVTQLSHTMTYNYKADPEVLGDEDFRGVYSCSCTDLPDELFRGETITMEIKAEVLEAPENTDRIKGMSCRVGIILDNVRNDFFVSTNGYNQDGKNVHCGRSTWHTEEYIPGMSDTLSFTLPEEDAYGFASRIIIFFESDIGTSYWTYRFIADN